MRATRPGTPPPDHTHRRPHTAVSPRSPLVRYLYPIPAQLMQPAKQFNDTTSHSFLLATIPFQLFHHRTICHPSTAQHDFFKKNTSGRNFRGLSPACQLSLRHDVDTSQYCLVLFRLKKKYHFPFYFHRPPFVVSFFRARLSMRQYDLGQQQAPVVVQY